MPLISFIIPYHNEPLVLVKECINSIMALPLAEGESEVIVVDDGSRMSIMEELTTIHPPLVYLRQVNGGLSSARNHGLSVATGEFIQFVDADDSLIQQSYIQIINKIRQRRMDMVMFNTTNEHTVSQAIFPTGTVYLASRNVRAAACGYVFRREMLGDLRFQQGILHEDELFTPLLLLRAAQIEDTGLCAYFYRQHAGTIMHKQTAEHISKRLDDILKILQHLQVVNNQTNGALARRISQLTMVYLYNIVRLTRSWKEWRVRSAALNAMGLRPLPIRGYSWKYFLFSLFL